MQNIITLGSVPLHCSVMGHHSEHAAFLHNILALDKSWTWTYDLNGNGRPTHGASQALDQELSIFGVALIITDDFDGVILCQGQCYSTQIQS
jgi:hypothetical protein